MAQTHSLDLEKNSSQYASITDASQTGLDITGDVTIEAWVQLESIGTQEHTIVAKWTTVNDKSYKLSVTNTALNFSTSSTGILESNTSISYTFQTGVWYHIAVTKSGTTVTFYVNGRNIGTSTVDSTIFNSSSAFTVGAIGDPNNYFDGLIKDVRVFNDARTQAEIVADAHTQNVTDANLQGEWNFNNNYNDTSGNGNNLTASNSPVFVTTIPWTKPTGGENAQFIGNCVSWWTLDETSGTREDSHGTNDLTDINTVGSVTGKQGNAAHFIPANTEYLHRAGVSPFGNAFTIAGWLRPNVNDVRNRTFIALMPTSGAVNFIQLEGNTTTLGQRIILYNSSGVPIKDWRYNDIYAQNTWVFIVATWDGTNLILYKNGIQVEPATKSADGAGTLTNTVRDIWVGAEKGGGNLWSGDIDEISIYNKALHYGEILDLYAGGAGIPYVGTFLSPQARRGILLSM